MRYLPWSKSARTVTSFLAFILLYTGFGLSQPESLHVFHDVHRAMGSEFSIDLYARDEETAQQWMQLSFDEVDRIEDLLSNYRPSSELSRISREAGMHAVTTDPETFAFLQKAFDWSLRTNGAFDITVGPLMRAWGFFFHHGRIPQQAELTALKKKTGWNNVHLEASTRTVSFTNGVSMELDPGSIGKGYAVDRIVALLREQHVTAALISAGTSTIYGLGAPPVTMGWRVNVPDPAHAGVTLSTIDLRDTSLSTAACTEKFFIKDGHRYCHILDPHTMRPVENMLQTTVVAPSATDSDALSTATFVMGLTSADHLLRSVANSSAVLVAGTPDNPSYHEVNWPNSLKIKTVTQHERGNAHP
jgi:thiamine biosynthesis lipoprotein